MAPGQAHRRTTRLLLASALAVLTAAVFLPVAGFDFINFDDNGYVTDNPHVMGGLSLRGVAWALTDRSMLWLPLTWVSLMADVSLFGSTPGAHHLVNVFYHAVAALLLFFVLESLTGSLWPSALTAALFAVHPLHVQSVAWISERKDVLSAVFLFLTIGAYQAYARRPSVWRYLPVPLLFTLGLMAKPMLVTAPALLLLLDYWPLGRLFAPGPSPSQPPVRAARLAVARVVAEKIPLLALACGAMVPAIASTQKTHFDVSLLSLRFGNSLLSYFFYIWKMFWPLNLSIFYPPSPDGHPAGTVAVTLLMLVLVSALALRGARRHPYLVAGWLWYLVSLAPVAGLVQIGDHFVADRYTYLPLVGVFAASAWWCLALLRHRPRARSALVPGIACVVLALGIQARREVGNWHDSRTVFQHALQVTGNNWLAHEHLGYHLAKEGQNEAAIAHYLETLRIEPDRITAIRPMLTKAFLAQGGALVQRGDLAGAEVVYRRMLDLVGGDSTEPHLSSEFARVFNTLGVAAAQRAAVAESIGFFTKAVAVKPDFAEAHFNLGLASERAGRTEEAIRHYREALRLSPQDTQARQYLDQALAR